VESGNDNTVAKAVEQREGKALVSACVVEGTETHKADVSEHRRHHSHQLIMLSAHTLDRRGGRPNGRQILCKELTDCGVGCVAQELVELRLQPAGTPRHGPRPEEQKHHKYGEDSARTRGGCIR
jgi:hypothetical protein